MQSGQRCLRTWGEYVKEAKAISGTTEVFDWQESADKSYERYTPEWYLESRKRLGALRLIRRGSA